ncbi:MAG: DUF1549 domain-containing protein [Gemmataceae bacterium]
MKLARLIACKAIVLLAIVTFAQGDAARGQPLRQLIDAQVKAGWQADQVTPVGRADDAAFLRRVYLDLTGDIPNYDDTVKFLADKDPQKRAKLIDRLLDDPRYAEHQADEWNLILFGRHPSEEIRKLGGVRDWLAERFAKNIPYDQLVRELLLAEKGTENFYAQFNRKPEDTTVAVTRIFLGTQLQCARCHDHPFERWTQKDFYGMTGFFVRLVVVDKGGAAKDGRYLIAEKSTGDVLFTGEAKDQTPGKKGEPVKPKFLGAAVLEEPELPKDFKEPDFKNPKNLPSPKFSRKAKLADWVVAADNPYFARAVANRVWAQFLGRGIVHPVDDLSEKNPTRHAKLLEILAGQMVEHKFDLKWYIRELCNSETYQLAASGPVTDALPRWYERARVRPLSAEEMFRAIHTATGYEPKDKKGSRVDDYFLRYLGEPMNGRGDFQGSLNEHLFFNNSGNLRTMIRDGKNNLYRTILDSKDPWDQKVDRMFLTVLNRPPRAEEKERFVDHLSSADGKPDVLVEEAIWVLLSCAEFRFNK